MKIPTILGFNQEALDKYFKNTGWLLLGRIGSLIIKIITGIALTNYLGDHQNGILNYPIAFTALFFAVASLGLDGYITRELLRKPEQYRQLLGTAAAIKFLGGLIILPLMWVTYLIISHFNKIETPFLYVFIVGISAAIQSFSVIDNYFQSKVQAVWIMRAQILGNILSVVTKILLIVFHASLPWFIFAILFDAMLLTSGYLWFYWRKVESPMLWAVDLPTAKHLIRNGWPLAFSAILVSIYMKIDQLMIDSFLDVRQLGIYSTVVSLSESWYFIPVAIVTSVFPAIMNAKRDDPERYQKRLQNLYDLMVWISLPIAAFVTFASPYFYRIAYDAEFWAAAPVLSIHIWAGISVFLGTASGQFLIAEGYFKLALLRTGMGALLNIVLNLFWLPRYGIYGAAFATLAAYFVSTFFILVVPKTRKQGVMMIRALFLFSFFRKVFHFFRHRKKS